MTIQISPADPIAHPGFFGVAEGVDLAAPLGAAEVAAIEAGMERFARAGVPRPAHQRRAAARLHPPFRPARERARRPHRQAAGAPAARGDGRHLQPRQATASCLPRDDRRRLFGLGNRLWHSDSSFKATPAQIFAAARRAIIPSEGRQHRVRRHARGLRRARRRDQGRDRGPGLRAQPDVSRAARSASPNSPTRSARNFAPVRQRLVRRHPATGRQVALSSSTHAGDDRGLAGAGGARLPARPRSSTRRSASSSTRTMAAVRPGDVGQPRHHAPRPPLQGERRGARHAPHDRARTRRRPWSRPA